MARVLYAPTEDFIRLEAGVLGADATAGTNVTVNVSNNQGLSENDFIVIGYEGNELAEIEQINQAISGNTSVRVATLKFNHLQGEPWVKYRYNKRKFYGSATEAGSYVELTAEGSPVAIQVDDPQGTLLEYAGSTYEYFKATYYNSQDLSESSIDDATATDGDESKRYATLYGIRKMAGLAGNPLYSDARIEVKRKNAESKINAALASRYVLPLAEVPGMITDICESLAAGSIDYEEFGKDGEGVGWIRSAQSDLKAIREGKSMLVGADGVELTRVTNAGVINGYPNNNTDVGAERNFTMADKY